MQNINLQHKHGVVRFRGTVQHNKDRELVFQSDDAVETMQNLEQRCNADGPDHGYRLIINEAKRKRQSGLPSSVARTFIV
jgi:hypothetical protein